MNGYAVLGQWAADVNGDMEAGARELRERIVPGVRAMPGFQHGAWSRSEDGSRLYSTIVFDAPEAAEALVASVHGNRSHAAASGVHLVSIEIQPLVASASAA
jgi:hypothetical protein